MLKELARPWVSLSTYGIGFKVAMFLALCWGVFLGMALAETDGLALIPMTLLGGFIFLGFIVIAWLLWMLVDLEEENA